MNIKTPILPDVAHAITCAQWADSFDAACEAAGGSPNAWIHFKHKTFEEVMNLMAPNGVRFCFCPSEHMDKTTELATTIIAVFPFLNLEAKKKK